ncbi:hypothetical protein DFH08DRAFT_705880 [Mycena albidolilacea]|uniref:Uncharacterized protein n=1 Tax=Mycena albidolilacea TaxID=1033008 RepID=A0AAD7EMY0_9AGAR|nr:hypothetical protein DFH08DRAFT_705880 [Mycena albidolilacea]
MAIFIMFVMAIVLWTLDLVNFIMETKITLIGNSEDDIDVKLNNALIFTHLLEAAQNVLYAYMTLLGDAIIIYRVWKLQAFSGNPWVLFLPFASIMLTNCVVRLGPVILQESFPNPLCEKIQAITYVMPCANTLVATILIGITMWYVNIEREDENRRSRRTQCERILVLLLESGILYFLFFATQVALASPPVHAWVESLPSLVFASKMYAYITSVIVGLYPTILIVLANSTHHVLDRAAASSYLTSLASMRIAWEHPDPDRDRTPAAETLQIGTMRREEIELDDLRALSRESSRRNKI